MMASAARPCYGRERMKPFEELDYRKTRLGELILQRRRVLALDGFEAALTDKAAKQRMWAYIKQLTPAAAPL